MAYLDDPAIQAMLAQKRSPMSFVSGLGRSRMDEIDAARSMQGQDAMFQQAQTAQMQQKPKGYLDQIYEDTDPAYFVNQKTGRPEIDNIGNFVGALSTNKPRATFPESLLNKIFETGGSANPDTGSFSIPKPVDPYRQTDRLIDEEAATRVRDGEPALTVAGDADTSKSLARGKKSPIPKMKGKPRNVGGRTVEVPDDVWNNAIKQGSKDKAMLFLKENGYI
jgi:hypothetical protein